MEVLRIKREQLEEMEEGVKNPYNKEDFTIDGYYFELLEIYMKNGNDIYIAQCSIGNCDNVVIFSQKMETNYPNTRNREDYQKLYNDFQKFGKNCMEIVKSW